MNNYPYIIIEQDAFVINDLQKHLDVFGSFHFKGSAGSHEDGLNFIIEHRPKLVFLDVGANPDRTLDFSLISELYRYLRVLPKFIILTDSESVALEALKIEVFDCIVKPIKKLDLLKSILKFERAFDDSPWATYADINQLTGTQSVSQEASADPEPDDIITEEKTTKIPVVDPTTVIPEEKPLIICVKSYGDYRFIPASDISYLKADNNSTDIHLSNGEMVTAFKTLKHFENVLKTPFVRIHNSYIVNIDYVSRIHTGNAVCYLKNSNIKLPFSKSYKENIDSILQNITKGNYLEI